MNIIHQQKYTGRFHILVCFIFFLGIFLSSATEAHTVFVGPGQDRTLSSGSLEYPFANIQEALNLCGSGDTVVVLPGHYRGEGNRNLTFGGKVCVLISADRYDSRYTGISIIDAEGEGVIADFSNDEGPGTQLIGFTLTGGDKSGSYRGVPGFFRFSDNANPTTAHLSMMADREDVARAAAAVAPVPESITPWGKMDPFHQPFNTTMYYGSGDVNDDGFIDSHDVSAVEQMIAGNLEHRGSADVTGDGVVDRKDVTGIQNYVAGVPLPAHWNKISNRESRNAWVNKILAIDKGNEHPYLYYSWVCGHFAQQLFINSYGYVDNLHFTDYDNGQTLYNLPVFNVSVSSSNYGHAINAVLVGDNPLNFSDWRFIEPQTDYDVSPGMWDMPYEVSVKINLSTYHGFDETLVEFFVAEKGPVLTGSHPELVRTRMDVPFEVPDNLENCSFPMVFSSGDAGRVVYGKIHRDMTPSMGVFLSKLPFTGGIHAIPLINDAHYTKILDVATGPDGRSHFLYRGKRGSLAEKNIYYAFLDPGTDELKGQSLVASVQSVIDGRVLITKGGVIHVFYWVKQAFAGQDYGIFWTMGDGSTWQNSQKIVSDLPGYFNSSSTRDGERFGFDAVETGAGLKLFYIQTKSIGTDYYHVYEKTFTSFWSSPSIIFSTPYGTGQRLAGLTAGTDNSGNAHLAVWSCSNDNDIDMGNLRHFIQSGGYWSEKSMLDITGNAACPRFSKENYSGLHLVWERHIGSQVQPVWNVWKNGSWQTETVVPIADGSNACYPHIAETAPGLVNIAYQIKSGTWSTIETRSFGGGDVLFHETFSSLGGSFSCTKSTCEWTTPDIDIAGHVSLNIFADASCDVFSEFENTDFLKMSYSIDGGSWVTFFNHTGGLENQTISASVAGTGNSLKIRIEAQTSASNETYRIDNLIVTGVPADQCPDDPNKTEPGECGCGVPEGTCGTSYTYEAENCSVTNGNINTNATASNGLYVDLQSNGNLNCGLSFSGGRYDVTFQIKVPNGERSMGVYTGNTKLGVLTTSSTSWTTQTIKNVTLGANLEIRDSEGTAELDVDKIDFTPLTVKNLPPVVEITSPADNTVYNTPADVSVTVAASDEDGTITKVELRKNGELVGTAIMSPYHFILYTLPEGSYILQARAYDNEGAASENEITIIVDKAKDFYNIEAESCTITNGLINANPVSSEGKYVDLQSGGNLYCPVQAPAGLYELTFVIKVPNSSTRSMGVYVDNIKVGVLTTSSTTWITSNIKGVTLGSSIEIRDSEGTAELDVDKIILVPTGIFNDLPYEETFDFMGGSFTCTKSTREWISKSININGVTSLSFSAQVSCHDFAEFENTDYLRIFFSTNGTSWTPLLNHAGGIATMVVHSEIYTSDTSIQFKIEAKTSALNETYVVDNLILVRN